MPLKQCSVNGKKGWKWGDSGKCYTGTEGRAKAMEQMKAIKSSQEAAMKKSGMPGRGGSAMKRGY